MQQPPNQEYPQIYVLDKIPFEEQRVIDELVGLWQTRYEPRDLLAHIRVTWKPGAGRVTWFFAQVRQDLLNDKHSNYDASSISQFKHFLETEYRRLDQLNTVRQAQAKTDAEAQAKAKEQEEHERRAKADFDALGKEMAKATTRAELVELGRKREDLAPHTGDSYVYENHCYNCKRHISSAIHARCSVCGWYICSSCDSCGCGNYSY
jgi:hypothetical protein